jgi:hypothetical protein
VRTPGPRGGFLVDRDMGSLERCFPRILPGLHERTVQARMILRVMLSN